MTRFLAYIARQANGLNLLLAVALIVLANFTVLPLYRMGARFSLPAPKSGPVPAREEPRLADFVPADYAILAQENLFHPERKIPPPPKKEEKALPRPDIVLYGTYIASDSRLAFIEEKTSPVTSPGRGQRHTVIGIGEKVLGFELKQIEPNRIVLVKDGETMTVTLEAKKQRSGGTGTGMQPSYATGRQPGNPPGQRFNAGQTGRDTSRPVAPTPVPPPAVPVQQAPVPPSSPPSLKR